jgi:prolyl oligopeptidase
MSEDFAAPMAEPRPVRVETGGLAYHDPFVWLEEQSAETLRWQAAQNAVAERRLRGVEGFEALKVALEPSLAATYVSAPHQCGDGWLRLAHGADGERVETASRPAGPWHPVFSVAGLSEPGRTAALDWFFPSPDGRFAAVGISWGGDEQCVLRLLDVQRAELLPVAVPETWFARVAWLPDSSGCYFPAGSFVGAKPRDLCFLRPGDDAPSRESLGGIGFESASPEAPAGYPQVSADGRWLTLSSERLGGRIALARRLPEGRWFEVLEDRPAGRAYGFVDGDDYVAVVAEDAPRGRLVRMPLETARDRTTWVEVLPESDEVLVSVDLVADRYVVAGLVGAAARLRVFDRQGVFVSEVPLPERGVVAEQSFSANYKIFPPMEGGSIVPCGEGFSFTFATPGSSAATYLYDVPSRRLSLLEPPAVVLDDIAVGLRALTGPEGRMVTYTLISLADARPGVPRPTLIYGYGGWNIAFVPAFLGKLAPFVQAGGNVVIANLAGGGEYGEEQWRTGRMAAKQGTFDNLYAVAEALIAEGVTTRAQLGVVGESNGGLLTAAAVAQRPELWGAVCVQVPITDMLRALEDPFGAVVVVEYGDPSSEDDAPRLMAWSPYHNLRQTEYPPVLVWTAENDARCAPWHARKFTARLQRANRSSSPILLRARADGGHLSVGTDPDQVAEWLGFLMSELGLRLPGATAATGTSARRAAGVRE